MSFENPDFFKRVDEDKKYVAPVDWQEADGRKVDNPNSKLDNNLDTKNPEKKFEGTKRVIDTVNTKEASEKRTDHPTPDEILAQLNSSFLWSAEKPKNSTEWWAQVIEWSAWKLETPTAS
jgi:hypothetical protein